MALCNIKNDQRLTILNLVCLKAPPSVSPDCKLAHILVNYPVVSARYKHAFCVMLGLRSRYQSIYSLCSEAHLARVGFGKHEIFKRSAAYI